MLASTLCQLVKPPSSHVVVSSQSSHNQNQREFTIDVNYIQQHPFLHCVDRAMGWSKMDYLCNSSLKKQIGVFKRAQNYRHGAPFILKADGECDKRIAQDMCENIGSELLITAANHHERNGIIERANHSMCKCYDRIRATDQRLPVTGIISKATY